MMHSTSTKFRKVDWFAIGVVAIIVSSGILIPFGLIIAIGTLIYAVKSGRLRPRPARISIVILVVVFLVDGGFALGLFSSDPMNPNEATRAQYAFRQMSLTVAQKEGVPSLVLMPVRVGGAAYPDGTKASLWVANPVPLGIRSKCFYVDEPGHGGSSGYAEFACGIPGTQVTLDRNGAIMIGYVGLWPAHYVSVTSNGITDKLRVTLGYFILPGALSGDPAAKFTITLMSRAGDSLGTVTDLKASGIGTPK
jgi:hypothetical protein